MNNFCGLDFGTSNSSIGFINQNKHVELAQFGRKKNIPSAVFFEYGKEHPSFGIDAIERCIDGQEGRMIWSPKNALGTAIMQEKTRIENKSVSFAEIIGLIIANIKAQCETQCAQNLESIVLGRPVHYNDANQKLDTEAQDTMVTILKDLGFRHIEFEFEPLAAAIHYEQSVSKEQFALIVDMGGGTSDFTVLRLDKNISNAAEKILSLGGIHIAGTNFDRSLSMQSLMPELGLGARYKTLEGKWCVIPPTLHRELATWHKIGFCYNKKHIAYAKEKIFSSEHPYKFERLLETLECRLGHHLARAVEHAKIQLSTQEQALLQFFQLHPPISVNLDRAQLESALADDIDRIMGCVKKTIKESALSAQQINAVFFTGGASLVPSVRKAIMSFLPHAHSISGDTFGSVARGLTLRASQLFQ